MKIWHQLGRVWYTGVLYILAGFGFVLYGSLFLVRLISWRVVRLVAIPLCLCILFGALWFYKAMAPTGDGKKRGKQITVRVHKGSSLKSITDMLEKKGVVPDSDILRIALQLAGKDKNIEAGAYIFYKDDGVVRTLRRFDHARAIEKSITIPEGLILEQVARLVSKKFPTDSARFVNLCRDPKFLKELGIKGKNAEGYLFPNTYRFFPNSTEKEIIRKMVSRFRTVFDEIESTTVSRKFTEYELVTLASIVEKEATVARERRHISGVFHNRLRIGMSLGADPTIRYYLRKFDGPLRVSELQKKTRFNTRLYRGLTPTPICSPGRGALEAAINPLKTKDLYFVAKWDGSGEHAFSRTYVEHNKKIKDIRYKNNVRKWKKRRNKE